MTVRHHPPTSSSKEEGEQVGKAPSSSEEGVGGGGTHAQLLEYARQMRNNPTEPERVLWLALKSSQLARHKFRRQAIIGNRIVDFFCPAKGLVIEIDGETHKPVEDAARDDALARRTGFAVLRFANEQVMRERDGVLQAIVAGLAGRADRWPRHHPPTPSSEEEGESHMAPSCCSFGTATLPEEGVGGGGGQTPQPRINT